MAAKIVGAKQLAMFADNPIRYCNLRGQLEGVGNARGGHLDDDTRVRPDHVRRLSWAVVFLGLAGVATGVAIQLGYLDPEPLGMADIPANGLIALATVLAGLGLWEGIRRGFVRRRRDLCKAFGLDPEHYRVMAASILGNHGRLFRADGVGAVPHVVFTHRKGHRSCHVGLYLTRQYSGQVHDSDLFRLTLQMGVVRRALGIRLVSGSIRYAGKRVKIAYSDSLYRSLVAMAPEYHRSVKRWWPENRLSLRHRQRVAAGTAIRTKSVDFPEEYTF